MSPLLLNRFAIVLCSLLIAAGGVAACGGEDGGGAGGSGPETGAGGSGPEAGAGSRATAPPDIRDFDGEWLTSFGGLNLKVSGRRVRGSYDFCSGTLSGKLRGERLEGRWKEDTNECQDPRAAARPVAEGTFSFRLHGGGDKFTGYYKTKGSARRSVWQGTRVNTE